jgi:hypothetical protein
MQSVQRMVSKYKVVPPGQEKKFLWLIYIFRTTDDQQIFYSTVMDLLKYFPECYRWLKFWLQPLNSSMILRYISNQDPDLFDHPTRTSNAIEAFHSTIYNLMPKKQSLNVSVRCILQIAKSDGDSLTNLYEKGIDLITTSRRERESQCLLLIGPS